MSGAPTNPRAKDGVQSRASDPAASVFVSANAGSGKTHVLAERVVRLLLAGAPPSRILCLTYTKSAAAEMQTRVFGRLAGWATASAAVLEAELAHLCDGRAPGTEELAAARRLFAEALETPGGLKIQTIHAFCEAILHQFPLEANIPGHFAVLDETESAALLEEARRAAVVAAGEPGTPLGEAFADALRFGGEWGLDGLVDEIVAKRDRIRRHLGHAGGLEAALARLAASLGLVDGDDEGTVLAAALDPPGFDAAFRDALAAAARASGKATDEKLCAHLATFATSPDGEARFAVLVSLCMTKEGSPRKLSGLCTKSVSGAFADFEERLAAASAFVAATAERLATVRLCRASRAALHLAEHLEATYAQLKRRRGRLDFEDLIVRTADLLTRGEAAAWVHHKLDGGIDHVLVDEAQDTSPRQWQVVRALADEFFAGEGARPTRRTVFAVGDEKQSIYSFQGASPAMFAAQRAAVERLATGAGLPFAKVELHRSFRSVGDVLAAVDHVFSDPAHRRGLSSANEAPVHETARGREPGLVEVWPAFVAEKTPEDAEWLTRIDQSPRFSPANRLARRIAETVRDWIGQPVTVKGETRPLAAGDVLVLVRKRSGFVASMGAALREVGIRVAGADRLAITDHIAVQDVMALGRCVANAEDELSLASVLKSPLFGFTDDELMALALSRDPERPEALYLALRRMARPDGAARIPAFVSLPAARARLHEKAARAFDRLEELRGRVGFTDVFSFFARLLGPEGGRARLAARLGRDTGDVLDAFLDLALEAENGGAAGLDAFLARLASAPPSVKRELEHGRGDVRIMTTHASKGLEAPVVFLVDPGSAPFSHAHGARLMEWTDMPGLVPDAPPGFLWCPEKSLANAVIGTLRERERAAAEDEYRRLLYVGMTRAAERLVVCGIAGVKGPNEASWLARVEAAMGARAREVRDAEGTLLSLRFGSLDGAAGRMEAPPAAAGSDLRRTRAIDLSPLPAEPVPPRPLAPSLAAGGALVIDALDEAASSSRSPVRGAGAEPAPEIRRGLLLHRLLQMLPDLALPEREAAARRYLAGAGGAFSDEERERILAEIAAVLDAPDHAPFFAAGSRAEVAVAGTVRLGGRAYPVSGTADRIAVTETEVLVVDYKSDAAPPADPDDVPEAYLLQLALYRELLRPLYPGRRVRASLLFTRGPRLMPLDDAALDAALERRAARGEAARGEHRRPSLALN